MTRILGVSLVALLLGLVAGQLLGLGAERLFAILNGYGAIIVAVVVLAMVTATLERLRPRSGIPAGLAGVATLIAAGPLGLYYVLPAVVIVTPIAVYRAIKRKHTVRGNVRPGVTPT